MMPRVIVDPSRPLPLRSLKNCLHVAADSLSPPCRPRTNLVPSSLTPMTTRIGMGSMLFPILIRKLTPSIKRYLIFFPERSRFLHVSADCFSSAAALLTSVAERDRPMSLLVRRERVLVL